jgi:hypothetical protein
MPAVTPADDEFHPAADAGPFWTETAWFAFSAPERRISGFVWPIFRLNQGVCSSGVFIWDDTARTDWDCRYSYNYWHVPLPERLSDMTLLSGLSYEVIKPLSEYRVRYDSDECHLDLTYEGLHDPVLTVAENHFDQACRVTGTIDLAGDVVSVDGYEMRDRGWVNRPDAPKTVPRDVSEGGYTYAINADTAFLARTGSADPDHAELEPGSWIAQHGVTSYLASGFRRVERDADGRGRLFVVEATDQLGREIRATGSLVNGARIRTSPAMRTLFCGVQWEVNGTAAWGEAQEWSLRPAD